MSEQAITPITRETFQAKFTFDLGAINLMLKGLGKLPAEESYDAINALKNGFDAQFNQAVEEQREQIKQAALDAENKLKGDLNADRKE